MFPNSHQYKRASTPLGQNGSSSGCFFNTLMGVEGAPLCVSSRSTTRAMNPRRSLALLCLLSSLPVFAQDGGVPLIARDLLFGNPERFRPGISPNAESLAWLAPDDRNVLQVWVRPVGAQGGAVALTADKKRGIRSYSWSEDSKSILFAQDGDGDENFHVFQVELASKNVRDLTPWQGVRASVLATSSKQPNVILVTANVRDRKLMDVYRIALDTGAAVLDSENPGDVNGWGVDATLSERGPRARRRLVR